MCKFRLFGKMLCISFILFSIVNGLVVKKPTQKKTESTKQTKYTEIYQNAVKEKEPSPTMEASMEQYDDEYEVNPHGHTSGMLKMCEPCPESITCVPQIQCPAHVRMQEQDKPQICDLPGGKFGFCCVTGQNHTAPQFRSQRIDSNHFISMSIIEEARRKFENLMHHISISSVQRGRPEFLHSMVFHSTPQEDLQNFHITNNAIEQVLATQILTKKEQIPIDDIITNNLNIDFRDTPLEMHCSLPRSCRDPNARYRSFDGSCNNPLPYRSHWGAAGQPMERLLPPSYEDGVWVARKRASDGSSLMGARQISRLLLTDTHRPHRKYNLMLMQFGQLVTHDVAQTTSVRTEDGELIRCCENDGSAMLPRDLSHFACMPIIIEPDDPFYSQFNVRCMNFVRLSLAPNSDCKAGYGKQRSKVTHFLDGSAIYGSNSQTMRELRTFHGGKLRMFNNFGHDLLPLTNDRQACESDEPGKTCFKSGDGRTNQIISLIVIHTIFAREHNRIADALSRMNPRFSDEKIFHEARRIVIAELQHITYNEFLPAVIGPAQMKRFRLVPEKHGYANGYSTEINPAITNEFSAAAFRMGHSMVDGKFHIHRDGHHGHHGVDEIINIPDVMFNPSRMRKHSFYDQMLQAMVAQPMQKVDSSITHGLSQYLFRGHNPFGLDLAAINIQRGRDQGLRPYNDYLELMGHRKIHNFDQLPAEIALRLSNVYRSPDDIDLWIGGLFEKPGDEGIVGITFAEMIADQFSRFKRGDRYYYEYSYRINPGAFNSDQLKEIRKATMARLICDNADHITEISPSAFVRADFRGNAPVQCDSAHIPVIDLEYWRV